VVPVTMGVSVIASVGVLAAARAGATDRPDPRVAPLARGPCRR